MTAEIHKYADHALGELHRLGEQLEQNQDALVRIGRARASIIAMVASAASGLGECRKDHPYASLRPIIDENGDFKWCCTHPSTHCSR
jgi:hypothetical protein